MKRHARQPEGRPGFAGNEWIFGRIGHLANDFSAIAELESLFRSLLSPVQTATVLPGTPQHPSNTQRVQSEREGG
ncbi:hypothetical protein [Haematobacter genomosp. 1]|uniref:Uncharacterized protein n=1 Tax=Haematobacter genomosp. 1 TaxID=366618 RepID=A0A212AFE8_9RHOB|nr:hypothetical protein [Haematobacter genomosp. 1]OWJ80123.1 hypothetical protein CDV49_02250 [Haematobacter genomosp. 1]